MNHDLNFWSDYQPWVDFSNKFALGRLCKQFFQTKIEKDHVPNQPWVDFSWQVDPRLIGHMVLFYICLKKLIAKSTQGKFVCPPCSFPTAWSALDTGLPQPRSKFHARGQWPSSVLSPGFSTQPRFQSPESTEHTAQSRQYWTDPKPDFLWREKLVQC